MKCEEVQPNLLDYDRGLLSGVECRKIKAHLDRCEECRTVLDEEKAFALELAALPVEEPANDVWALVRAQTRPRVFRPLAWLAGARRASSGLHRAIAATALAATAAFTIYSFSITQPPAPPHKLDASAAASVKWSDDPLGKHTDVVVEVIDGM